MEDYRIVTYEVFRGVSEAVRVGTGERVALKRVADPTEISLHEAVHDHAHIVRTLGTVSSYGIRRLVLEWAPYGDLFTECDSMARHLPPSDVAAIAVQLASALQHCHACGILHCDVKCENVLVFQRPPVDAAYVVKLADFGLAVRASETALVRGTLLGMAPERLRCGTYGPAADAWSLGVLLYEICAGSVQFLVDNRESGQLMPPDGHVDWTKLRAAVDATPDGAGELIGALLREDPAERLALSGVAEHVWVASF